jgi:hypothetical protein
MAQRTHVELIDDIDGTKAAETIAFAIDSKTYEIDLSTANAAKLRKALEPYVKVARKISGGVTKRATRHIQLPAPLPVIRAWAKSKGLKVSDRGRVPNDVVKAYEDAHK